jgi:hypothetical protein
VRFNERINRGELGGGVEAVFQIGTAARKILFYFD